MVRTTTWATTGREFTYSTYRMRAVAPRPRGNSGSPADLYGKWGFPIYVCRHVYRQLDQPILTNRCAFAVIGTAVTDRSDLKVFLGPNARLLLRPA